MQKTLVLALAATSQLAAPPAGATAMLENYFECTTNEGVTFNDVVAFKNEYEAAVQAAGIEGYNLKVMFPVYDSQIGEGHFTWYGSFATNTVWAQAGDWFHSSEWPARFNAMMNCQSSSLWRADD
ncbi:MAG: hypothetical protein ABR601_07420 [Parasphingopyxis sp.]|nr:hypothetical protein [Sphingomonadales bacterium]